MTIDWEAEIKKLVSEVIEVPIEKLSLDTDFIKDMDVDSLKAIEIVAAFEKKYKIIVPEQEIPKIKTIRQIINFAKKAEE